MYMCKRKWREMIEDYETEINMIGQFAYRRAAETGEKLGVTLYNNESDYGLHIFSARDECIGQVKYLVDGNEELILLIFDGTDLPHGNLNQHIKMQLFNCLGEVYNVRS